MVAKSNFVGGKCGVYVFAIYTMRHVEMVEKLLNLDVRMCILDYVCYT